MDRQAGIPLQVGELARIATIGLDPMCIYSNVRSNLFHDRLLSLRLWRREALTRDLGGTDHLVECDSTTTLG